MKTHNLTVNFGWTRLPAIDQFSAQTNGKTLPELAFSAPQIFFHLWQCGWFTNIGNEELLRDATRVYNAVTRIALPDSMLVEYYLDGESKFVDYRIVPECDARRATPGVVVADSLSLEFPYSHGCTCLGKGRWVPFLREFKQCLYGHPRRRITKRRAMELVSHPIRIPPDFLRTSRLCY